MEKKEIDRTVFFILIFVGTFFLMIGFALKYRAKVEAEQPKSMESTSVDEIPEEEYSLSGLVESLESVSVSDNGRMLEYDDTLVPTYPDGVFMGNNEAWLSYYAGGRHCAAFISESNLSRNYNVNFFEVNGCIYTLPLNVATFPWDKSLMDSCNFSDYTEMFYGEGYGEVNPDLQIIFGNTIYLQRYPDSDIVNAVHIDAERMILSDESMSASIAGIEIGMTEKEVIYQLGEGTQACTLYAVDEYSNVVLENVYNRTFYKNGTGILVISYNDSRIVEAISLYSDAINHN